MGQKVYLTGYGECDAKPAKEVKVGDIIVWNYGHLSKVEGIEKETSTQIVFQLSSGESLDNLYYKSSRRCGKDRLLGIMVKED